MLYFKYIQSEPEHTISQSTNFFLKGCLFNYTQDQFQSRIYVCDVCWQNSCGLCGLEYVLSSNCNIGYGPCKEVIAVSTLGGAEI